MMQEKTISETTFKFPGQTGFYKGKVRDVYEIEGSKLLMIASDRISAFDVVLPRAIPYKGQVLNQLASLFLSLTKDIVPNWVISVPDENVTMGKRLEPFKVEMVIRGYLAGHAWREYKSGKRQVCGVKLPDGLIENDKLPHPIITPTTKASEGHDLDISAENIIKQNIVSSSDYQQLENFTQLLFERGTEIAAARGLLLVDTKYEFGKDSTGTIYLIDEIHTPDSSRYFYASTYNELQKVGAEQKQLSKEFVRKWLIDNNFQGLEGQVVPEMTDEIVNNISNRYIELYEQISGKEFIKANTESVLTRIEKNCLAALNGN